MEKTAIIILAAGAGTRMGSNQSKVLFKTRENTLISHVLETAFSFNPEICTIVLGYEKDAVKNHINNKKFNNKFKKLNFVTQEKQLGTGHAVKCALSTLKNFNGSIIILCGDVPLIKKESLLNLVNKHNQEKATISILTLLANENHYGRIIRDSKNHISAIREFKDCNTEEKNILETNSGVYCVDSAFLNPAVNDLDSDNSQKEFYLTDIVERAYKEGQTITANSVQKSIEVQGVNTHADLTRIKKHQLQNEISNLQKKGVVFLDPENVFFDKEVSFSKGVQVGLGVQILGQSVIGENVIFEGHTLVKNSSIGSNTTVKLSSRIDNSKIGKNCSVGPFANIRPESKIADDVKIGNFVEIKKSNLANGVKAGHLSYLGDATVGENTNIGAGTITCNYDGKNKHQTKIGSNCFIGSDTTLVAPLELGNNSYIGAGSSIRSNVEEKSLALTKGKLVIKKNWSK